MVVNTVCLMAASSAMVWGVAPNRSFGGPRLPFQQMLAGMPSNVFDVCGPQRQYTMGSRIASLAAKVRISCCHHYWSCSTMRAMASSVFDSRALSWYLELSCAPRKQNRFSTLDVSRSSSNRVYLSTFVRNLLPRCVSVAVVIHGSALCMQ